MKHRINSLAFIVILASAPVNHISLGATLDIVWQTNAHIGPVWTVDISASGLFLASGGDDGFVNIWNLTNPSAVAVVETPASVLSVALSPSAATVLTGGDNGAVTTWSVAPVDMLCGGRRSDWLVWSVDISSDGTRQTAAKSEARLELGSTGCVPGGYVLGGHSRDVFATVFSPDNTHLASASEDGTAKLWRVSDGALLRTLTGHSIFETNEDDVVINAVYSVDFSPDGTLLATAGADGTAQLWRVADGSRVRVLVGGGGIAAKFSADGKTLYTVENSTIMLWRVADGRLLTSYTNTGANCLAVCPDGRHFAYGTGTGSVVLARVPLWVEQVERLGNQLLLRWTGGSGLYQLQRTGDAVNGPWENVSTPTVAHAATNTVSGPGPVFYRVQSLPPPP